MTSRADHFTKQPARIGGGIADPLHVAGSYATFRISDFALSCSFLFFKEIL